MIHSCSYMIHIHVWTISFIIHTWTCMNHVLFILDMYDSYLFIHDSYSCMNYFIHNSYMDMYEPCTIHTRHVWFIHDPIIFMYLSCMIHTCSFSMGFSARIDGGVGGVEPPQFIFQPPQSLQFCDPRGCHENTPNSVSLHTQFYQLA